MDSQTLGIGVFCGVVLGAVLIGLIYRSRVRELERRAAALDGDLDDTRTQLAKVKRSSEQLLDVAASSLSTSVKGAQSALASHANVSAKLTGSLASLLAKLDAGEGADVETDAAVIVAAEHATDELAGRERRLDTSLEQLLQRIELISTILEAVAAEDRMTQHKLEDLVSSATDSISVVSTMGEVISKLQAGATETAQLSTQVSTEAERGYRAVHRTLDEIERIRTLSGAARSRIEALGERVQDIGNIVKVIQEITEKTNLLALNASIIAAQAGEHGRSFSVVASEIKALAQRTAASTKEISEQIRSVQEESERATAAMVDGVAAVGEGFQVAISAGDALDAIRQSAKGAQKKVQNMNRTLRRHDRVAQQMVDSAAAVGERATSFEKSVRGNSSAAERLRTAATDIQNGALQIAELLREQRSGTALCVDNVQQVADRMTMLRRREVELRAGLRELDDNDAGGKRFGDEMLARWTAVEKATARLRDGLQPGLTGQDQPR